MPRRLAMKKAGIAAMLLVLMYGRRSGSLKRNSGLASPRPFHRLCESLGKN
jgi:hypothetical protein